MLQSRRSFLKWMGIGTASVGAALVPIKLIPDVEASEVQEEAIKEEIPEAKRSEYGFTEYNYPYWVLRVEMLPLMSEMGYMVRGLAIPHDQRYPSKYFAVKLSDEGRERFEKEKLYREEILGDINTQLKISYKKLKPNFWGNKMVSKA